MLLRSEQSQQNDHSQSDYTGMVYDCHAPQEALPGALVILLIQNNNEKQEFAFSMVYVQVVPLSGMRKGRGVGGGGGV